MPERVLISLEDIDVNFGGKPLFEGIGLHVNERDRVCLVGKNGAGKTTLMRLITGELEPDAGKRFALPGLTIGYLAQNVVHQPDEMVRQFVLNGLPKEERSEDKQHLADVVIAPLMLEAEATMSTLSGGQLRRAALARALVAEPDVLLLDEPTNHLDLTAIEWLEKFLQSYRGALICVSHDRAFLKAVSRKVFWIDRGAIRTSPRGYAHFDAWADQILEQEAREIKNLQKKFEAEVDWTQGGVTGRRKRNIRRLNELHRLREKLRADKASYNQTMRTIALDPLTSMQASKIVAEFKHVDKSFTVTPPPSGGRLGGRPSSGNASNQPSSHPSPKGRGSVPILKDFNLRIVRGDRIGILGKNGSGKSTFLKLLLGELHPDNGSVWRGKNIEASYFDQNRVMLNPNKRVWDILCPDGGDYVFLGNAQDPKPIHVCGYLKNFLFDPRIARDKVGTLSGGQQNRLMLAKVLAQPGNLLILDEPTNDLDMDTLDMLQEIIADFPGTLIIVSHDRDFLDRTVTKVLAFEGDAEVQGYIGGYSDYLEAKESAQKKKDAPARTASTNSTSTTASPSDGSHAPPILTASSENVEAKPAVFKPKMSFKLKHELEKLPARMEALEKEIAELKETMLDPDLYTRDPERFDHTSRRIGTAEKELADAETRWLELEDMRG